MVSLPPPPPDDKIRIMACDPGTTTLGLSLIEVDIDNFEELPRVVWSDTISVKNPRVEDDLFLIDGGRKWRVEEIQKQMIEVIEFAQPSFFITETPFFRRGKMSAYESGVELQTMIHEAVRSLSLTTKVYGINPISVKHYIGVDHIGTGKEEVRQAVLEVFKDHTDIDLSVLDEHSIDSIAVGHYFWRFEILEWPPLFVRVPKPKAKGTGRRRRRRKGKKK